MEVYASKSTGLVITTKCTLNCRYCLNFQPYIAEKRHIDVAVLRADIDLFFQVHDVVEHFSLTGGEPFVHPALGELLLYTHDRYGHQVRHLDTATNCTVVPSDKLCQDLVASHAEVTCTIYPASTKTNEVLAKLRQFGVIHGASTTQFVVGYPPDRPDLSEAELREHYRQCRACYSGYGLKRGKLYACCCSMAADTAGICTAEPGDYLELAGVDRQDLINWHNDQIPKGYLAFCKLCNGMPPLNPHKDPGGVSQSKDQS